jgi:heme-degrading monooxygenase HmoA
MPRFIEMDERTPLAAQMETNVQPVILINTFTVGPGEAEQLVTAWAADAAWMQQQPGFISAQLHRGVADSGVFINYAVWQSNRAFPARLHGPGVPGAARAVSGKHHGFAPSVQEGGGAPYLHRLSTLSRDSWTYDGWPSDAGES